LDEAGFDMALPVEKAIRLTAVHTDAKDQILINDVTPDLVQIKADTLQIRQILINLLSNAVRFTPEGSTITVGCEKTDPGGVALRVTDTGIGIAARDIRKVLEPFGQVRHDSLRAHGGTGLTLSKHLTEMHGGTLEIESAPGEGTTVIVTLPRERVL
jgi:signal transduction histidine kinase